MDVYIVQYHCCDGDFEEFDVVGVYADKDKARRSMREHMKKVRVRNTEYYGDRFHEDFEVDWPDMIQFGFYAKGFELDHVWTCSIETAGLE